MFSTHAVKGALLRNQLQWRPSKCVIKRGKLVASRDWQDLRVSSRLVANIVAKHYADNLPIHARGKLIDLGCGKVPLYSSYNGYVSEVICVDWENTLHKNNLLDFECDLSNNLPIPNGEFDTAVLSDVLEHIPNPDHLIKEISRRFQGFLPQKAS